MPKSLKIFLIIIGVVILLLTSFTGGVATGWFFQNSVTGVLQPIKDSVFPNQAQPEVETPSAELSLPSPQLSDQDLETLFEPFWQTWKIVHDDYVDQPVDDVKMMQGAISGMLESLGDKHTSYMDPDEFKQQNMDLEGEYEGIGAWVDITGEYIIITSPMPDSPADKAGLKPGDTVVAIDGEDMTGIDGNLVLRRILGPAGTEVTLTIRREGQEAFDVTIQRAKIVVPSVILEMREDGLAYIQLTTFGDNTTSELRDALREMNKNDARGLILDVRYNGGGYLDTAIEVTSEFVEANQIVMYEEFGDGSRKVYRAYRGGLATEIPLVILVNEGTASASEILSGAIQDYERGLIVGATTYGKGSVQNWAPLVNDQGAVRVTIARWLTPDERQIHGEGIKPDFEVEYTDEDYEKDIDPQLDKAVEVINTLIE